jgi:phosphatidylinositol-3-phosphatase
MSKVRFICAMGVLALFTALGAFPANAQHIKTVFVIAMENHNWTQPVQLAGGIQQVFGNPNAPFINSLVNGTAPDDISDEVAYATAYRNVLFGTGAHIHPSEPNYLWAEAGTNFGILNDDDPYKDTPPNSQNTGLHLTTLLTEAGKTWRSYQEDIDVENSGGAPPAQILTNIPLPEDEWTVPLVSFSGHFVSGTNLYNGSTQYNYAAKHNPMVFFDDTNGGNNTTTSNPLSTHYAPLQQLATDLANDRDHDRDCDGDHDRDDRDCDRHGSVADYIWITPDQYNDMHTALTGGYKGLTGDAANIKQGDDFLSQIVPLLMDSDAYKDDGAIIIWWDESESDGVAGDNADDNTHSIGEIVISRHAHHNVGGLPYASSVTFTHSSDLRTMQNIFHVAVPGPTGPYLGDAANATDLSDLFEDGAIPKKP